jgi:hypothetical protein
VFCPLIDFVNFTVQIDDSGWLWLWGQLENLVVVELAVGLDGRDSKKSFIPRLCIK